MRTLPLLLACACASAPPIVEPQKPAKPIAKAGGPEAIEAPADDRLHGVRPTAYKLRLDLDPKRADYGGQERIDLERDALAKLRYNHTIAGLESPKALSEKKRDIARLLTEQNARKNAN